MSIQAVAWALEQSLGDAQAKLVLISLCNSYNSETGKCFPSHSTISREADCSKRTVIRKLKWLGENGWITVIPKYNDAGRTTNSYYITNISVSDNESLTDASVSDTVVTGVSDTVVTPIRKVTVSSSNRKLTPISPKQILKTILDEETTLAVIAHRKSLRKPLTERAAKLMVNEFAGTSDPQAAADEMILRGWQSIKAEWFNNQQSQNQPSGMDMLRAHANGDYL